MSGASYFGSKISLISKAGIRYEGILFSIDPKESTVALSKVKSFGTENRVVERPVLPRDQVFEFIIFRSSDIHEIHVCEPPQTDYEDPAIVTISQNAPKTEHSVSSPLAASTSVPETMIKVSTQVQEPALNPTPLFSPNELQKASNIAAEMSLSSHTGDSHHVKGNTAWRENTSGQTYSQSRGPAANYGRKYDNQEDSENKYHSETPSHTRGNYAHVVSRGNNQYSNADCHHGSYRQGNKANANHSYDPSTDQNIGNGQGAVFRPRGGNHSQDVNRRMAPYSGENKVNCGGPQRGAYKGAAPRGGRTVTTQQFKDDYDFETENAKIAEELSKLNINVSDGDKKHHVEKSSMDDNTVIAEEEVNETEPVEDPNPANFYNKKKSFFDTISSESADRAKGVRPNQLNRREEQRVNVETFGPGGTVRGGGPYRGASRGGYYDRSSYRGGKERTGTGAPRRGQSTNWRKYPN